MSADPPKKTPKNTLAETPASKRATRRDVDRDDATIVTRAKEVGPSYMIPDAHPWAGLWKVWAAVALVGAVMTGAGFVANPRHEAFAYVAAFGWGLTICLGALFFVLLQHLTSAGWSVIVRRGAEQVMTLLPFFAVLFLPLIFFRESLYPWAGHEALEPAVQAKAGYLNFPFWLTRAVVYFGIWSFLAFRLFGLSRQQDSSGDPKLTLKMQGMSAPGMLFFALSLTFAGFDWLMSLDPAWYSTMFGVYLFGGAVVSIMSFLNLLFTRMQAANLLTTEVTEEHFHDLGKLMFAFTVFWAYIGFSQYMLIWYANIPEETLFFKHRQEGGWGFVSIALVLGHFFFPFFLMLSRNTKRVAGVRTFAACWILMMHFIDLYWLVMPNADPDHELHFNLIGDLGAWMLIAGLMMTVMFRRMVASPIVPVRDPRFGRSLRFENQ